MPDDLPAPSPDAPPETTPSSPGEPERAAPQAPGATLPSTQKPSPLAIVAVERVLADETFRLREVGGVDELAGSMARLGQLFPIELRRLAPQQYQVVTGFRRIAAARMLKRPRVLARIHPEMSDEDALLMALADLCLRHPRNERELREVRERLDAQGRLSPAAAEMIDGAIAPAEGREGEPGEGQGEVEVELDELARDVLGQLGELNQDLAALSDYLKELEPTQRRALLEQLRYPRDLADYLETLR